MLLPSSKSLIAREFDAVVRLVMLYVRSHYEGYTVSQREFVQDE